VAVRSTAAGLTTLNSKISHTTGSLLQKLNRGTMVVRDKAGQVADRADQVTDRLGQLTTPVTAVLTRPGTAPALKKAAVSSGAVARELSGNHRAGGKGRLLNAAVSGGVMAATALLPPVQTGLKVARLADRVTAAAGSVAAATTMTQEASEVTREKRRLVFFKSTQRVSLWKSSLTSIINRRDVIGTLSRDNILSSDGVMFETGGKTWHRGTSVIKMPSGTRTISHLQSLNALGDHYYFDRPLSDEQAARLAGGQLNPETIPGYVGRITATEALCPALAGSKRLLLLAVKSNVTLEWNEGVKNRR